MQNLWCLKNKFKTIIGIGLFLTYPYFMYAQFDNIWKLNFSTLDFSTNPPTTQFIQDSIGFIGSQVCRTNICDSSGQYLFNSNSEYLGNSIHDTMKNGALFTTSIGNTFTPQGSVILPLSLINKYLVIHHTIDTIRLNFSSRLFDKDYQPTYLLYSIVDMEKDNAKGEIVLKNNLLIYDTLANGRFTVCRHANGKDWWLLANEFMTNCYYTILIHADGTIEPAFKQCIGNTQSYLDQTGQACFSPDGKYYCNAVYNDSGTIDLFRFDRCAGLLYNYKEIKIPKHNYFFVEGCAFSPNSNYLYFCTNKRLYQYDLMDSNVITNLYLVDSVDIPDTSSNWFIYQFMQLAPNNKIYIGPGNPFALGFNIIDLPNEKNCNIIRFGQSTAYPEARLPFFPYYYLYGSAIYAADAGTDKTICPGDSIILGIKAVKDAVYEWIGDIADLNDIHLAQPRAIPTKTYNTYYLHIIDTSDAVSCKERWDTVHVTMIDACIDSVALVIQNPQSALEQAFFTIQNLPEHSGFKMYNMLGELIYQTDNYQNDYPLAKLSTGYYIYELKLSEENIFKKYYYKGKVLVY